MPRIKKKPEDRGGHASSFDTKVVVLKKTQPTIPKPKNIPGVSSSVMYNEATDTLVVKKFPRGFGKAVRMAREKLSLNQKQLAAKISKPLPVVFDIEKEDAIYDKDVLVRLEKALQTKFDPKFTL
ncbi:putative transcription factor [Nematocida homosporus]|uniref:putative transcription factor n=1 Tax=Nematocida homosporus TaxID=1912981 RepID=UPI002220185F|nr:putative transcription factor [Nematocida homosporus]KAI5184766.1 putative transcription factor [Nematocida homosporus]